MLLAVVVASAAVLVFSAPAAAHGQLAFSDPAHQSTVSTPVDRVSLYFTERPNPAAYFAITSPSGKRVDHGWSVGQPKKLEKPVQELTLRDGKWEPQTYEFGFPAVVPVAHWPEQGVYTIKYLSVASDGDKVSGEIRFDYQGPKTEAPPGWQPPVNQPALPGSTAPNASAVAAAVPAAGDQKGGLGFLLWLIPVLAVIGVAVLMLRARKVAA